MRLVNPDEIMERYNWYVDAMENEPYSALNKALNEATDYNDPPTMKERNPQELVAVALTMEEWGTVLHWLQYGADYHHAKMHEWLAGCHDKQMGAAKAARHEKESKEAAALHKFIEENIMGPRPEKPEDPEQPARWIWDEYAEIDFDGYMCSKCGNKFNHKYYTNVCEFKFCPSCGCRMNEEAGY